MAEQNITPTAEPTPAPTLDGRADMKTPQNSRAGMKPAPTAGGYEIRPYTGNSAPTYDDRAEREQMDWLAQIQKKREALAEQRKKDDAAYQRRADNARKWAAWMDALSAAGNLLWTTRNSGNLRDANASVDKALQARLAEKTAWRDKQRTAMDAAMERATAAQGQIFSARTAAAQRRYQRALADANLAAKNEANRITSQYNADRLRQQKDNADRQYNLNVRQQEEHERHNRETEKNTAAGIAKRGTGGKPGEHRAWDRNGNLYWFRSAAAAKAFAQQEGTWNSTTSTTSKNTPLGKENSTRRQDGGYPGMPKGKSSNSKGNNNGKIKKIPWQHPAGGH